MPLDQAFSSIFDAFAKSIAPPALQVVITLSPIMLAVILCVIFWELWVDYVQGKQFLGLKYTVLELKLPKETFKSPRAMEVVLNSLHNTADGSHFAQYWKGETRPWYSLELISVEGQVKFMIWTEDRRKTGVMSALYSQFPGIEIKEVEDYTRSVHFDPNEIRIYAGEFEFTKKEDKNGWAYPIKTYVDYGLDKDPKEEFKVDPLLPMLEFLGSVGPNQEVWIQIPIRAHKDDQRLPGYLFKKGDLWKDMAEKEINKLMIRDAKTKATIKQPGKEEEHFADIPRLSKGEQDILEALARSTTKLAFDCGIRALYIAKKDIFNPVTGIGGIVGNMKQFNTEHLNGFKPNGKKWHNRLGDPWLDYKNFRRNRYGRLGLMAYKRRSYFYGPFKSKMIVMNTEELATIYHFPGSVAQTPSLERVPSKKAQAPVNLPI